MPQRPIPYADPALDRAGERRTDEAWIAAQFAHPTSRVAVLREGKFAWRDDGRPVYVSAEQVPGEVVPWFLGLVDGIAHFVVEVGSEAYEEPAQTAYQGGREAVSELPQTEGAVFAYASALSHWHRNNAHCARCGHPTRIEQAGHVRRCTDEACGRLVFPRTDPAVITLITRGEQCLLARRRVWSAKRRSTIAGFVEPGETLEHAVAREVFEEVGVQVGAVTYRGSQPWPFPQSLMLGFWAEATSTDITVDGDEIGEAYWYTAAEIAAAVATDNMTLPQTDSISSRLVDDWLRLQGVAIERTDDDC
jgi:NAD+ diphosphatase